MYYSARLIRFRLISLSIAFILLCTLSASAQNNESKILLRSGEKVKGTITAIVPDEYITVVTTDDSNRKILASDILEIDDEPLKRQPASRFSIIAGLFAGYDVTTGLQYTVINPNVIVGAHFKKHWRLGAGVGFLYANSNNYQQPTVQYDNISSNSLQTLYYLPVFGNLHYEFFGKKRKIVSPSLDLSLGYPINVNSPSTYTTDTDPGTGETDYYKIKQRGIFYGMFSPGVSFKVSKSVSINVAATFNLTVFKELNVYEMDNLSLFTTTVSSDTQILGAVGGSINIIY